MNEYKVRVSITEVHQIVVEANSEDEAVELANGIDLQDWSVVHTVTNAQEVKLVGEHN
jgi:capsular polysaccharide biosynthesis protein